MTFAVLGPIPASDCQLLAWPCRCRARVKASIMWRHLRGIPPASVVSFRSAVIGDLRSTLLPLSGSHQLPEDDPGDNHREAGHFAG